MNAEHFAWTVASFKGDLPEYRHTLVGQSLRFLDAFAYHTHGADITEAYQQANSRIIRLHYQSTQQDLGDPHWLMTHHSQQIQERAKNQAEMLLTLWWTTHVNIDNAGKIPTVSKPSHAVRDRYLAHTRVLCGAFQEVIRSESTYLSSATVLNGSRLEQSIRENIQSGSTPVSVDRGGMTYEQIQSHARLVARIWQYRVWESTILRGIAQEAAETGSFELHPDDAILLRLPSHILAGLTTASMQEKFSYADMASERSFEPTLAFVRAHRMVFEQRNTAVRRLIRYFQST